MGLQGINPVANFVVIRLENVIKISLDNSSFFSFENSFISSLLYMCTTDNEPCTTNNKNEVLRY